MGVIARAEIVMRDLALHPGVEHPEIMPRATHCVRGDGDGCYSWVFVQIGPSAVVHFNIAQARALHAALADAIMAELTMIGRQETPPTDGDEVLP